MSAAKMPTAGQARVMLGLLYENRRDRLILAPDGRWASFDSACDAGWITETGRIVITDVGRDALARYLLRAWRP